MSNQPSEKAIQNYIDYCRKFILPKILKEENLKESSNKKAV